MGVPGLCKLVDESDPDNLKPIKLHNSFLVIDGNNISANIYRYACQKSFLNGDYNEFKQSVKTFFGALKQCDIFPIVILDGAHEARKMNKITTDMRQKIVSRGKVTSVNSKGDIVIPALLSNVFNDVMSEMKILFCRSIAEADLDITKAAQFLNCPILSQDSDFFLDDVTFIPLFALDLVPLEIYEINNNDEATSAKYFLQASYFDRSRFLKKFGDIPNISFLPILSFLLGNDYSFRHNYDSFFSHLSKLGYHPHPTLQQRMALLCTWLWNFKTPEDAVHDFLDKIPSKMVQETKQELLRCLNEKNIREPWYMGKYLHHAISAAALPEALSVQIRPIDGDSDWLTEVTKYVSTMNYATENSRVNTILIPEWILKLHIEGKVSRALLDLLFSRLLMFSSQIEFYALPSVSPRHIQILQSVIGIIFGDHLTNDPIRVTIYSRIDDRLEEQFLLPLYSNFFTSLSEIPKLSLLEREKIALNILKIECSYSSSIPDNWRLLLYTLADLYRADCSTTMESALGCLIFSSILLGVVDLKLGSFEKENKFFKNFSYDSRAKFSPTFIEEDDWRTKAEKSNFSTKNVPIEKIMAMTNDGSHQTDDFFLALSKVDHNDCLFAVKYFSSYRDPKYSLQLQKQNHELNRPILHCFAQFHNSVLLIELLNAVLNHPFQKMKMAEIYCGTLAYNVYFKIDTYENLEAFVISEFKQMPSLKTVFLSVLNLIENLSGCEILSRSSQPQWRR